jgi:triphosphatase
MSLFGDLLQDPQSAAIKSELKWLAGELAPARDLDVLTKRVATAAKKQHARWHGVPSLSRELAEKREGRGICPLSRTDVRDRGVARGRAVDYFPK